MAYKGIYPGKGAEALATAIDSIVAYQPPDLPEVARELSCAVPDYRGFTSSRFRFLLSDAGVAIDIVKPFPTVTDESGLVIQIGGFPKNSADFPTGSLDRVFDSQLGLRRGALRLIVARTELFAPGHAGLLAEAGLGELVVASFTTEYTPNTPYTTDVRPDQVRSAIPALPGRLIEMATQL